MLPLEEIVLGAAFFHSRGRFYELAEVKRAAGSEPATIRPFFAKVSTCR